MSDYKEVLEDYSPQIAEKRAEISKINNGIAYLEGEANRESKRYDDWKNDADHHKCNQIKASKKKACEEEKQRKYNVATEAKNAAQAHRNAVNAKNAEKIALQDDITKLEALRDKASLNAIETAKKLAELGETREGVYIKSMGKADADRKEGEGKAKAHEDIGQAQANAIAQAAAIEAEFKAKKAEIDLADKKKRSIFIAAIAVVLFAVAIWVVIKKMKKNKVKK